MNARFISDDTILIEHTNTEEKILLEKFELGTKFSVSCRGGTSEELFKYLHIGKVKW